MYISYENNRIVLLEYFLPKNISRIDYQARRGKKEPASESQFLYFKKLPNLLKFDLIVFVKFDRIAKSRWIRVQT